MALPTSRPGNETGWLEHRSPGRIQAGRADSEDAALDGVLNLKRRRVIQHYDETDGEARADLLADKSVHR